MDKQQTIIILLSLMVILQLVTAYGIFKLGKTGITAEQPAAAPAAAPTPAPAPAAPTAPIEVSADDDPSKGPKDAPVTIITFSDYQCPYCSRAEATMKQVEENYKEKVRIVFRDFPLGFHDKAQKAAEASECADDQGKFWEFHDKMFANQNALAVDNLKQYAKDLSLDTAKFDKCLDSGEKAEEVKKDMADGSAAGVTGTPMSFINGVAVRGAQPYEAFAAAIDAALAK